MNRRQFIKLTGAVGTMAAVATVPRFAKQLEEGPKGNVEFANIIKGTKIHIGTKEGVKLWSGVADGGRVTALVPTEFNGDEVFIEFRKRGYKTIILEGHTVPTDGSTWTLRTYQQLDSLV